MPGPETFHSKALRREHLFRDLKDLKTGSKAKSLQTLNLQGFDIL
jgi:hypothetical protein